MRAMVFIGSVLYIVGLILTDISYTLVDPRIRFGMMAIQPILLWSDLFIWLLVGRHRRRLVVVLAAALRAAWARVARNRVGMASATLLAVFVLIGLVDSLHYRPQRRRSLAMIRATPVYAVEVLSALDALLMPCGRRSRRPIPSRWRRTPTRRK